MKHIFIINPTAGKHDSRQRIYDMADMLRQKHGLEVQCILTKKQGHATEIAKRLCESGEALRFYACGGDGTVNEVANGIIGYDNAAMTVIPVGTGNDFLKNFGDDMDKFKDAENLWDGPQFPMDAIDVNGRVALTIACSGIDARVAKDVHKYSESPLLDGKGSYIYSLAVNFLFDFFLLCLPARGTWFFRPERLVPAVSTGYILLCLWVLVRCRQRILPAFAAIVTGAFSPRAVTGGLIGSAFVSLRTGCARGIFTNEAGMGTASMAYAAAQDANPAELGLLGLIEVFADTIVICSLTALAVLTSGITIPYGVDAGGVLPFQVFSTVCGGWASAALTFFLCVFAFATVLGWGLYGARCGQFLFGPGFWKKFVWMQMGGVLLGAVLQTQTLWLAAEIVNGLMAVPNLIALIALSPELARLVQEYKKKS